VEVAHIDAASRSKRTALALLVALAAKRAAHKQHLLGVGPEVCESRE
jgi:hypothetical protein